MLTYIYVKRWCKIMRARAARSSCLRHPRAIVAASPDCRLARPWIIQQIPGGQQHTPHLSWILSSYAGASRFMPITCIHPKPRVIPIDRQWCRCLVYLHCQMDLEMGLWPRTVLISSNIPWKCNLQSVLQHAVKTAPDQWCHWFC